jgi:hypothetical protein
VKTAKPLPGSDIGISQVELEITIKASRERVWKALVEDIHLATESPCGSRSP